MAFTSHWSRYLLNGRHLKNAIRVLSQDVSLSVQYDHYKNGSYETIRPMQVHAMILSRIVQKIFIDSNRKQNKSFGSIIEAINAELIKLEENSNLLMKLAKARNANQMTMFSNKVQVEFMGTTYTLKLEEDAIERFVKKQKAVLKVLTSNLVNPIQAFPVPKNSDSSTSEYRQLIAKPKMQETILTAMVAAIAENLPSVEYIKDIHTITSYNQDANTHYDSAKWTTSLFGTRYEYAGFSNYIVDYDNFKVVLTDLRKKYANGAMRYLDIKNFFGSISHDLVAEVLWDAYRDSTFGKSRSILQGNVVTAPKFDENAITNDEAFDPRTYKGRAVKYNINSEGFKHFVSTLLKFEYIGLDQLLCFQDTGLTIESHTQHAIATLVLKYLFKRISKQALKRDLGNIDVVGYVDDIFIFAESPAVLEGIANYIEREFKANGLIFSDKKDSGMLSVNEVTDTQFKELVRLPGVAYFDFAESDADNFISTEKAPFENRTEIIGKAKETVAVLTSVFGSSADALISNLLRNDNSATHSSNKTLDDLNRIQTTIHKLDIMRKKLIPLDSERSLADTSVYRHRVYKHLFNATMHKLLIDIVTPENRKVIESIRHTTQEQYKEMRYFLWDLDLEKLDRGNQSIMFIRDLVFWLNNRQNFDFNTVTAQNYINSVEAKDDTQILQALQYFYLQSTPSTKEQYEVQNIYLMSFARAVLAHFPSKIKFLAAVLKVSVIRWRLFTAPHVVYWQPLVQGVKDKVLFDMWQKILPNVRGSATLPGTIAITSKEMLKQWFIKIDKSRADMVDSEIISQYYLAYRMFKFSLDFSTVGRMSSWRG